MNACHGNLEEIDTLLDLLQTRISKRLDSKHNVDNLLHIFSVSVRGRDGIEKKEADRMKLEIFNSLNNQHDLYECYCRIKQYCDKLGLSIEDVWYCFSCQFDKAAYDSNKQLVKELRYKLVERIGYVKFEDMEV
jgi:hypothetical protein